MKQMITIALVLFGSIGLMAQTKRDDKNLEIARTILLNSLNSGFWNTTKVSARRIVGEGILFDVKDGNIAISTAVIPDNSTHFNPIVDSVTTIVDHGDKTVHKNLVTYHNKLVHGNNITGSAKLVGEVSKDDKNSTIIKDFLVDYTTLFNSVGDNEVVTVKVSNINGSSVFPFSELQKTPKQKVTYTLKGNDIKDFNDGKIKEKELRKRIIEKKVVFSKKLSNNLKVFSKVMKDIYNSDGCSTYFVSDDLSYDYDENFGLTINMTSYSSRGENDSYNIPCLGLQNISSSQRNTEVAKMYPNFLKGLKENFLNYGTTISGLKDDEKITLKTMITLCKDCSIPRYVEMTTTPAKITAFITGKADIAACLTTKEGPAQ